MTEFWDLTPHETWQTIQAAAWRWQREYDRDTRLAWLAAGLQRSKRLPLLKSLLSTFKTHKLRGEELERRRTEHEALRERMLVRKSGMRQSMEEGGQQPKSREGLDGEQRG